MELENGTKNDGQIDVQSGTWDEGLHIAFQWSRHWTNSIWRPNLKDSAKRGPIPKKLNKTGNFQRAHQPKRNSENGAKKQGQKRRPKVTQNGVENPPKTNSKSRPEWSSGWSPEQRSLKWAMTGQPSGDWVIRRAIWQAILGQKTGQKTRQYSPHWDKAGFAEKQRMTPKLHRAT
jgi:hypothetical protein